MRHSHRPPTACSSTDSIERAVLRGVRGGLGKELGLREGEDSLAGLGLGDGQLDQRAERGRAPARLRNDGLVPAVGQSGRCSRRGGAAATAGSHGGCCSAGAASAGAVTASAGVLQAVAASVGAPAAAGRLAVVAAPRPASPPRSRDRRWSKASAVRSPAACTSGRAPAPGAGAGRRRRAVVEHAAEEVDEPVDGRRLEPLGLARDRARSSSVAAGFGRRGSPSCCWRKISRRWASEVGDPRCRRSEPHRPGGRRRPRQPGGRPPAADEVDEVERIRRRWCRAGRGRWTADPAAACGGELVERRHGVAELAGGRRDERHRRRWMIDALGGGDAVKRASRSRAGRAEETRTAGTGSGSSAASRPSRWCRARRPHGRAAPRAS